MKQLLIGLWGPAGVGKDSVADALGFPKTSFASQLKRDLEPILTNLGVDLNDRQQKEKVRPLMVALGATARAIDPNHWIKRLSISDDHPVVVISDVRYWNEILFVSLLGGVVYEIVREGFGPANGEEERSFAEIRDKLADLGVYNSVVVNDTPKNAAGKILDDLNDRAAFIYNNL